MNLHIGLHQKTIPSSLSLRVSKWVRPLVSGHLYRILQNRVYWGRSLTRRQVIGVSTGDHRREIVATGSTGDGEQPVGGLPLAKNFLRFADESSAGSLGNRLQFVQAASGPLGESAPSMPNCLTVHSCGLSSPSPGGVCLASVKGSTTSLPHRADR